ncbi:tyrosine-type recombinase/integrase [Spongiactinospora sp. TRM90649]|uniref:tyrosine-type recombinase/integrase n=1 Tax=Spongiactinospora sp. TRM90649 TaxID=3031114 RepID=UPI0023F64DA6|nr:tyrosine-type recombinase/integrase [Spongiactinospora sp. TRM90649]MDF5751958.1 tyrosine-type recombinase/integrase [Spongiactinospora sp. TRM90649]
MDNITYRVRFWKIKTYKGSRVTTHTVRWVVESREWKEPFRNIAQARSFQARLMTAAREGEAFDIGTGRPISWKREESPLSWYAFTLAYVKAKWPYASPNHRRGIAEALTDASEALYTSENGAPSRDMCRAALRWAYSTRIRDDEQPPAELAEALRWLEGHTIALAALAELGKGATLARGMLDRISRTKDGSLAAANTANRKRMVLNNAMEYAMELGALSKNPLKAVKWTRPRTLTTVDPRTVINAEQARRFLAAVHGHSERGQRMKAFFGVLYYAALRPEEAVDLRREHLVSLPEEGWGEMRLTSAEPRAGSRWTNSGQPRERRALKHRADGETRSTPIHPELVNLFRWHLEEFGTGPDGRVFIGPRGGLMTDRAYLKVFHEARTMAFSPAEAASSLMNVPYALRHAAVSTWLTAGVPAPQVAEWAGHSVAVLLKVYVKCVHGQEGEAMRRIWDATRP